MESFLTISIRKRTSSDKLCVHPHARRRIVNFGRNTAAMYRCRTPHTGCAPLTGVRLCRASLFRCSFHDFLPQSMAIRVRWLQSVSWPARDTGANCCAGCGASVREGTPASPGAPPEHPAVAASHLFVRILLRPSGGASYESTLDAGQTSIAGMTLRCNGAVIDNDQRRRENGEIHG